MEGKAKDARKPGNTQFTKITFIAGLVLLAVAALMFAQKEFTVMTEDSVSEPTMSDGYKSASVQVKPKGKIEKAKDKHPKSNNRIVSRAPASTAKATPSASASDVSREKSSKNRSLDTAGAPPDDHKVKESEVEARRNAEILSKLLVGHGMVALRRSGGKQPKHKDYSKLFTGYVEGLASVDECPETLVELRTEIIRASISPKSLFVAKSSDKGPKAVSVDMFEYMKMRLECGAGIVVLGKSTEKLGMDVNRVAKWWWQIEPRETGMQPFCIVAVGVLKDKSGDYIETAPYRVYETCFDVKPNNWNRVQREAWHLWRNDPELVLGGGGMLGLLLSFGGFLRKRVFGPKTMPN